MRSLMVQGAGSVVNMATKGKLKSKQLTKWILKKQKKKGHGKARMRRCRKTFTDC